MSVAVGIPHQERLARPGSWSANHSPVVSRSSSIASTRSAQSEPGWETRRHSSVTSDEAAAASHKHGIMSLFGGKKDKKEKKPKEKKKSVDNVVLTSRHSAAVKTKLMMEQHGKKSKHHGKTAGVVGTTRTNHLTAMQQEARHPHSGVPTLHVVSELPLLTRIVSGDEYDDEDELDRRIRQQEEWEMSKKPTVDKVVEHSSENSTQSSANASEDESEDYDPRSKAIEYIQQQLQTSCPQPRRPSAMSKSSFGSRFHRDEHGNWKR